jgi:hypothetical protein
VRYALGASLRPTVGLMAYFAGQNSKSECIALKICTYSYCKIFVVSDYEFDIRFIKFKMADPKWRMHFEKN